MKKISAENITAVKKATGAGTITCKNALIEANGNIQIAISILKKKQVKARIQSENNSEPKVQVKKEPKFAYKNEELVEHYKQIAQILPKRKSTVKINLSVDSIYLKCNECEEEFELEFDIHYHIKNKRHIHCVYCGCQNTTVKPLETIDFKYPHIDYSATSSGEKVMSFLIALIIVVVIFFLLITGMLFILELFA